MTGWDSRVVEATASRSALLFGEGIMLRTLEEGSTDFVECSYLPDRIVPFIVESTGGTPKKER